MPRRNREDNRTTNRLIDTANRIDGVLAADPAGMPPEAGRAAGVAVAIGDGVGDIPTGIGVADGAGVWVCDGAGEVVGEAAGSGVGAGEGGPPGVGLASAFTTTRPRINPGCTRHM